MLQLEHVASSRIMNCKFSHIIHTGSHSGLCSLVQMPTNRFRIGRLPRLELNLQRKLRWFPSFKRLSGIFVIIVLTWLTSFNTTNCKLV
ncbi:hypothetical protein K438DRAFT_1043963 [Mycena galopus ATCC 62051]|nr:hypothetical protein K438DRAFT_1043963 [Mycena galopus ATCC 62051]